MEEAHINMMGAEEEQQGVGEGFLGMEEFSFGEPIDGNLSLDSAAHEKSSELPRSSATAEHQDPIDTTNSQINSQEGSIAQNNVAPKKRGRPKKVQVPQAPTPPPQIDSNSNPTDNVASAKGHGRRKGKLLVSQLETNLQPQAFSTPAPRPDLVPGSIRTSGRSRKATEIFQPIATPEVRPGVSGPKAKPPPQAKRTPEPTPEPLSSINKKVISLSAEELQREEDELDRAAGISKVYINPKWSTKPNTTTDGKPIKGRPKSSTIVCFKSDKLKDPNWLEEHVGSWVPEFSAIRAAIDIAAEDAARTKQPRNKNRTQEDEDEPPKKKRKWTRNGAQQRIAATEIPLEAAQESALPSENSLPTPSEIVQNPPVVVEGSEEKASGDSEEHPLAGQTPDIVEKAPHAMTLHEKDPEHAAIEQEPVAAKSATAHNLEEQTPNVYEEDHVIPSTEMAEKAVVPVVGNMEEQPRKPPEEESAAVVIEAVEKVQAAMVEELVRLGPPTPDAENNSTVHTTPGVTSAESPISMSSTVASTLAVTTQPSNLTLSALFAQPRAEYCSPYAQNPPPQRTFTNAFSPYSTKESDAPKPTYQSPYQPTAAVSVFTHTASTYRSPYSPAPASTYISPYQAAASPTAHNTYRSPYASAPTQVTSQVPNQQSSARQLNQQYGQFNSGRSCKVLARPGLVPTPSAESLPPVPDFFYNGSRERPTTLKDQYFDYAHEQNIHTKTPQTPGPGQSASSLPQKRPSLQTPTPQTPMLTLTSFYRNGSALESPINASQDLLSFGPSQLPDFVRPAIPQKRSMVDAPIYGPVPKRQKSSLTTLRQSQAPPKPARTPRKKKEATAPLHRSSCTPTPRASSIEPSVEPLPTKIARSMSPNSAAELERVEEAALLTAESVEFPDVAVKLACSCRGDVGNLVLSKNKLTLTFVGVNQRPPEIPFIILPVMEITEHPSPSLPGSKPMELTIQAKRQDDTKVLYKFRIRSSDHASEVLTNMRHGIVQGMVIVNLQKQRNAVEDQSQNKPEEVGKPFKCDTCDGTWKNYEGIKYHKEKSHTFCNPFWIQQMWQQAPTFMQNSENSAWDQPAKPEIALRKGPYRKKQKKFVLDLVEDNLPEDVTRGVWQQPPACLPNPETGAWNIAPVQYIPAQPTSKPKRQTAKKRKHTVDLLPKSEKPVQPSIELEPEPSMEEDDEEDIQEWLERQESSRKRRRRESSDFEDEELYVPEPGTKDDDMLWEDDTPSPMENELNENTSGSDEYGALTLRKTTRRKRKPRKPHVLKEGATETWQARNMKRRWDQAREMGMTTLAGIPNPNSSGPVGNRKWVHPKIKTHLTEEEKTARRARAMLREQAWKQPIVFLQNPETGAWNQKPIIPQPTRKNQKYQRRYKLPEPITFMQRVDSTWSFRPFGHGAYPIYSRPGRRTDGNPGLKTYLARLEQGHRPVVYPKKKMIGPPMPSLHLLRKLGEREVSAAPGESPEFEDLLQPDALPGLPGPHSSAPDIIEPKRRGGRKRRQSSVVEDDDIGRKRRKTGWTANRRQSTTTDPMEDGEYLGPTIEESPRRPVRLSRGTKISYEHLTPAEPPQLVPKKLDPQVGRRINPGLDSLPESFGLDVPPRALSTQGSSDEDWPSITINDGSFKKQGWWPDAKWFLNKTLSAQFSLTHNLIKNSNGSSGGVLGNSGSRVIPFFGELAQIAEWEQVAEEYLYASAAQGPEYRWINHTPKYPEKFNVSEATEIEWLEENSFSLESLPYSELDAIGEDVILIDDENDHRTHRRINNRPPKANVASKAFKVIREHKTRRLTATRGDLEGILDTPEAVAAEYNVELAPEFGNPKRRMRFDRQDSSMTPEIEAKLIVTVVVMRTLTGGLDQQIDFVLVHTLFPKFSINYLTKTWMDVSKRKRALVEKLGEEFKEPFLKAYQAGILGYLNYDKLVEYDWEKLINWVMKNVNVVVETESVDLPQSRAELEDEFNLEIVDSGKNWRDVYYGLSAPVYRRMEATAAQPKTAPLKLRQEFNETVDDITLARSWARAVALTPEGVWDAKSAALKLHTIGNGLVEEAVASLLKSKVIVNKSRQKRALPGRSYETSIQFTDALRRHVAEEHFIEAANFKALLDAKFADPDGDTRRNGLALSTLADEGTVMCITNLQAQGRINLVPINVPSNKFGLLPGGGYETRKLDRRRLHFDILIFPTVTYVSNTEIPELNNLRKDLPPLSGPSGELPVWRDIEDRLMPAMWRKTAAAVLSIVSKRTGIGSHALKRELSPALELWELRSFTEWAVEVGALVDIGEEDEIEGDYVEGWSTGEWWWLMVGVMGL